MTNNIKNLKIGLDIHGVIDKYPDLFYKLTDKWSLEGHEIHIVTGQEWLIAREQIGKHAITYKHHFSMVDYHRNIGTHMYRRDDVDGWWMDREVWIESKGMYAGINGLDIHFDDQLEYAPYFPPTCTFVHVKDHFDVVAKEMLK